MPKVLLWDLDNTVLDFNLAQEKSLKSAFERFELGVCTQEMIDLFNEINSRHWEMLEKGETDKEGVFLGRFEEFFECAGINKNVSPAEINDYFENGICHTIAFIDDSFNLLRSLGRDYTLYCVTNGQTDVQKQRIKISMLSKIFKEVFISEEIGADKPSKEFFDYVLKSIIPCEKDEILIIGDSLSSDMKGGNNAGIKCCWFNPKNLPQPSDIKIDYQINSLQGIKKILGC